MLLMPGTWPRRIHRRCHEKKIASLESNDLQWGLGIQRPDKTNQVLHWPKQDIDTHTQAHNRHMGNFPQFWENITHSLT